MKSTIVAIAVIAVSGCASNRLAVPPGEDWREFTATVASRGQSPDPVPSQPEPKDPSLVATVVPVVALTTAKVGATCLILGAVGGLLILSKGNGSLGGLGPGLNNVFGEIWSWH
jgi:hypothetical protein